MRHASLLLVAFSAIALTAACGSQVVDTQTSGTNGGGAGGAMMSTTGSGGVAGGTTSTTVTGTTTSTGAGGASLVCGGKIGMSCGPDEYCDFGSDPVACGAADGTGFCQPKPQGCPADCPGVCGCDGYFYCNECGAHAAGVDVSFDTACYTATDTYRAVNMITSVPRFAILKASPLRNLCFRLMAVAGESMGIGIYGDSFAVMSAEVTNDVHDCDFQPGFVPPPKGESFATTTAMGGLFLTLSSAGCAVGMSASVKFPGAPAWVPADESFYLGQAIPIEGGCP